MIQIKENIILIKIVIKWLDHNIMIISLENIIYILMKEIKLNIIIISLEKDILFKILLIKHLQEKYDQNIKAKL